MQGQQNSRKQEDKGGCILNFFGIIPMYTFSSFCCSAIPTSCYILKIVAVCVLITEVGRRGRGGDQISHVQSSYHTLYCMCYLQATPFAALKEGFGEGTLLVLNCICFSCCSLIFSACDHAHAASSFEAIPFAAHKKGFGKDVLMQPAAGH